MSGAPIAVEPIIQKAGMDCGIAALGMYLGLPYRVVSDATLPLVPDAIHSGLSRSDLVNISAKLGYDLKRSRKFNLDTDHGVLFLQHRKSYHWVVLFEGVLINPTDGLVWNPEAYCGKTHFRPVTLLHLTEDEPKLIDNPPVGVID